jgi:hypothetical protein
MRIQAFTQPSGMAVPFDLGLIRKAPGFEVPKIEGTVEGWRAWTVAKKLPPYGVKPKLQSVTHSEYIWHSGHVSEAECCYKEHTPADAQCACGFYSAKNLKHLMKLGYHGYYDFDQDESVKVIGQVANWGQVTEGTQGWRAQYSYPVMLFVPFEAAYLAKPLQESFGCKVRLLNFLKEPGDVNQVTAVEGKHQKLRLPTAAKQQGARCEHKTLPFKGFLSGEPYEKDGEKWVQIRWDANPGKDVQVRMVNLNVKLQGS